MRKITKTDAIKIIHDCAVLYGKNLSSKNVLFICTHDGNADCVETLFMPHNFMHLTGVGARVNSDQFFRAAIDNKLSQTDITLKQNGITEQKLNVLPQLMSIHITARMVGDYDNTMPLLIADKFAGTVTMAMGFVNVNGLFIPKTALKKDVRDITTVTSRRKVIAIFVKHRRDPEYTRLTYMAKEMFIDDDLLQIVLRNKVNMQKLTSDFPIPIKPTLDTKIET